MFPYHDDNQAQRSAVFTLTIIALNVLVWLVVQGAGSDNALAASVCNLGLIPGELTRALPPGQAFPMGEGLLCVIDPGAQFSHVVTSMFLHGSWMHLIGNMWFLWLFGNNVEDVMSRLGYVAFYLLSGISAALLQIVMTPDSPVPMVGASGAISGVMGAYLVLYPRVRVYTLVFLGFFFTTVALPAWVMLIYWMVIQVAGGFVSVGQSGGTAFWAHVGGFVAGVVLVRLFVRHDYITAHRTHSWAPARQTWTGY